MGAVNWFRKTSLPSALSEGEIHHVLPPGQNAHIQYVVDNNGIPRPPAVFAHGHEMSDIVGLQAALNAKASVVTLTAGIGITGGGDTSTNRSFAFDTAWGDARYRPYISFPFTTTNQGVNLLFSNNLNDYIWNGAAVVSGNATGTKPFSSTMGFMSLVQNMDAGGQIAVGRNADEFAWRGVSGGVQGAWNIGASKAWVQSQGFSSNSGTVTQVGLIAPTGFTVLSAPVTGSGNLQLGFSGGYSLPTTSKQVEWDAAYFWGNHAAAGYLNASSGKYVSLNPNNGSIVDLVSGVDIDAINKTSRFYSTNGTTYPSGASFGFVDTIVSSTDFFQTFVAQNQADAYYYRVRNGSTIRPWRQVASRDWVQSQGYSSNSGTVTQVGLVVPTGFNVTSSPVTGSGNVSFAVSTGYFIPTSESKTAWDAAYFWGNHAAAGYTPGGRTLTINGVTQNLTANRSWTVASGVTQVGLVVPNGFNVTSAPVTGSGNVSFAISDGYFIPTNESKIAWDAAYFWGNHAAAGYVPGGRTITINGHTQNLTENRSWNISVGGSGTVTQVGLVVPQGFDVLSAPVTGSGNLQFGLSGGYSLVNSGDRNNWNGKVSGNGASNYIARWNSANNALTWGRIFDDGSSQMIISASVRVQSSLVVDGNMSVLDNFYVSGAVGLTPRVESSLNNIPGLAEGMIAYVARGNGATPASGWGFWGYFGSNIGWRILSTRVHAQGGGAP
jgi:hypothetical protein